MKNSRFTVATHIMAVLRLSQERHPGELMKSHMIAESVNTSPIVIRRILGKLREAGLVEVFGGATGGASLARDARQITLLDVYQALDEEEMFALHPNTPSALCPVGSTIKPILSDVYHEVSDAVQATLQTMTLEDICRKMMAEYAVRETMQQ